MPKSNKWFKTLKPLRKKIRNEEKPSISKMKQTHQSTTLSNNFVSTVIRSHKMLKIKSMEMFLP